MYRIAALFGQEWNSLGPVHRSFCYNGSVSLLQGEHKTVKTNTSFPLEFIASNVSHGTFKMTGFFVV